MPAYPDRKERGVEKRGNGLVGRTEAGSRWEDHQETAEVGEVLGVEAASMRIADGRDQ